METTTKISKPKLNKKNVKALLERMRKTRSYDQSRYFHSGVKGRPSCGTPACLYGHAFILMGEKRPSRHERGFGFDRCKVDEWLGMDSLQGAKLVNHDPIEERWPTRKDAIATLENLLKTGEVQWPTT